MLAATSYANQHSSARGWVYPKLKFKGLRNLGLLFCVETCARKYLVGLKLPALDTHMLQHNETMKHNVQEDAILW